MFACVRSVPPDRPFSVVGAFYFHCTLDPLFVFGMKHIRKNILWFHTSGKINWGLTSETMPLRLGRRDCILLTNTADSNTPIRLAKDLLWYQSTPGSTQDQGKSKLNCVNISSFHIIYSMFSERIIFIQKQFIHIMRQLPVKLWDWSPTKMGQIKRSTVEVDSVMMNGVSGG